MGKGQRISILRWLVNIGAVVPLVWLGVSYLTNNLSFNPIQTATSRTGDYALWLLWLSLACTPVYLLTGWSDVIVLRRPLGLFAFVYAAVHMLIFVGWDYGFRWAQVLPLFGQNIYLMVGAASLFLLFVLALTSYKWSMRLLGIGWRHLHRFVYVAAVLVVIHYALVVDGNILKLQGDILEPLAYGLVLLLLLVLRLPFVRSRLARRRREQGNGGFAH